MDALFNLLFFGLGVISGGFLVIEGLIAKSKKGDWFYYNKKVYELKEVDVEKK